MPLIRHLNIPNAKGEVYCCLRNRVVGLDEEQKSTFCGSCRMYGGDAGGRGVACDWDDVRDVEDPHLALDAQEEWASNQDRKTTFGLQPPEPGYGGYLYVSQ